MFERMIIHPHAYYMHIPVILIPLICRLHPCVFASDLRA